MRSAVPALEQVARGEGLGNRDQVTRVAAIEALSGIGSATSLPVFEVLSRTQSLFAGGRDREVREAALIALRAQRGRPVRDEPS